MEKIQRWIYGFFFLLGGVLLFIFGGAPLIGSIGFLSNINFYFLTTFLIIVMLYGVILILIGTLIMSVSIKVKVKKKVALIIFLIGILIVILPITVIIVYFFIIVKILSDSFIIGLIIEIFSGIGVIYLGIRLFFPSEEKKKKEKKILTIVLFIVGLIISLSFGLSLIFMVSYKPESVLYVFPFFLLPFQIGIILLIYSIYSTKERKNEAVLPILRGIFVLLIFLYILVLFLSVRMGY
jgi:hypothetical protein